MRNKATSDLVSILGLISALDQSNARAASRKANTSRTMLDAIELRRAFEERERQLAATLPSLSRDTIGRVVQMNFGLALTYEDDTDEQIGQRFEALLQEAIEAKKEWAVEFATANLNDQIKPAYDKAIKADVDPVAVLRADLGLSEEKAEAVVAAIRKDAEDKAAANPFTKEK